MTTLSRRRLLAAVGAAALAGCTGSGADGGDGGGSGTSTGTGTAGDSGNSGGAGSFPPVADERLILPMERAEIRSEAVSGGPPKDGIPSIDDPSFVGASGANFLADGDPVFGVARDGVAKAYPQKILVQHEIVNDDLAGTPVAATYCPLTGTAMGFERGSTTFGVSGRLVNDNLIMYDRATEAWWPQVLATTVPGPWNEEPPAASLREFRLIWTTWGEWREQHPDTKVLSTETGFPRNYGRDPYGSYNPRAGYYADSAPPLFPPLREDDRYDPKRVVIGARTADGAAAFLKDSVRSEKLVTGDLAGDPLLAVHDPRYDTAFVYRNPGEAAYEYSDGSAVGPDGNEHAPDALPLDRVYAFDAMWFAWAGFYPGTSVHG
jgi:hypothetical protein